MNKPEEYIWIKVWGRMLGSMDYYIEGQQELASKQNAPVTAIYTKVHPGGTPTGKWSILEEVTNPASQRHIRNLAQDLGYTIPDNVRDEWGRGGNG